VKKESDSIRPVEPSGPSNPHDESHEKVRREKNKTNFSDKLHEKIEEKLKSIKKRPNSGDR
jgi:hypothetical protein